MLSRVPSMLRLKSVCGHCPSQDQVIKCWMHVVRFGVWNARDGGGFVQPEVSIGASGEGVTGSRIARLKNEGGEGGVSASREQSG